MIMILQQNGTFIIKLTKNNYLFKNNYLSKNIKK